MLRAVLACARRRPSMDQSLALMHRWSAEIEPQEPFDRVRNLLAGYFAGTESFEDTAAPMRRRAAISTTGIERDLRAFETVLSGPLEPGLPLRVVAWDANWVLDEPSDENALVFLHKVADMLRTVLAEANG